MNSTVRAVVDNPLLRHELRSVQRQCVRLARTAGGRRLVLGLVALGYLAALAWWARVLLGEARHPSDEGFLVPAAMLLFMITVLAPTHAANVIATERQKGSWDLLLVTPLTAREIVWGKLLGCLGGHGVFMLGALPFLALGTFRAEHPARLWLATVAVAPLTALLLTAVGLVCSARSRAAAAARATAVGITIALVLGPLLLDALCGPWLHGDLAISFAVCPFAIWGALLDPNSFGHGVDGWRGYAAAAGLACYALLSVVLVATLRHRFDVWLRYERERKTRR
jgi:hypothetical protein